MVKQQISLKLNFVPALLHLHILFHNSTSSVENIICQLSAYI